jgi:hypothetical protein
MVEEFQLWFIDRMNQTILNFDFKKSEIAENPVLVRDKKKALTLSI